MGTVFCYVFIFSRLLTDPFNGLIAGIILKFAALCFEIPLEENIRALLRFSGPLGTISGRKQSSAENENGSVGR